MNFTKLMPTTSLSSETLTNTILAKALPWFVVIAIVRFLCFVLKGIFNSRRVKGATGEGVVKIASHLLLPDGVYHAFHDVTIPSANGTTQIDHIYISRMGIFVVETKNYSGWIFGSADEPRWTQKFRHKSVSFQNPLRQNLGHIRALESLLSVPAQHIHSVVVFTGDAVLKTPLPHNVTNPGGGMKYIKSFRNEVFTSEDVRRFIHLLRTGEVVKGQPHALVAKAAQSSPQELGVASSSSKFCPKCGKTMVHRTAKRGIRSGNSFWGCSTFPICQGTLPDEA
jgi:restriction system protein